MTIAAKNPERRSGRMRTARRLERTRRGFLRLAGASAATAVLGPLLISERTIAQTRALCVNDAPRSMIFALLADGVPRDKLYPLDIDRAFKKLDRIKPHIKVWWREGNQSQQLIRDSE